jgi:hypothetical protein
MQNYHQRQMNNNNNINNNYHHQQPQMQMPSQMPRLPPLQSHGTQVTQNTKIQSNYDKQPLNDEEFLLYYQQKYPEEYEKLIKEAYLDEMNNKKNLNNINSIHESPYENNEGSSTNINNNEDLDEKGADMERILNNPNITNISPLELFLCNTKLYNDFFPFFKRQNILSLEEAILFKNYQIKNKELSSKVSLKNFNKELEFLENNFRNIREELPKLDRYQQILYLMQKPVKFDAEITLDSNLILKSFINGTSTPNFCKMNKFQTQNLKPSSLYSANLQKFRINKLPTVAIEGFTNLQNLYLDSNRIQKIQGLHFPNLEELSLSDNYIRKIENLGGCPKLKILNLSYNNIHILENIQNNIYLENINLSNQFIPRFIIFIIKPNCALPNNRIQYINIENSNLVTCSAMVQFPYLQEVNIKSNQIDEMMDVLSVVKSCPYLRKINCLNNPFIAANKSTYRNFIIIGGRNLIEVDEKEVKENEKIYVNQLYNRKFGKKRGKSREKVDVDIGKQNLIVTKVSRPPPKGNIPSPYDYYKYH